MDLNTVLKSKCKEFDEAEKRASFYYLAREIVEDKPLHASVIILAIWNTGRFKFTVNEPQNLIDLRIAIEKSSPLFTKLKGEEFQTANFDNLESIIEEIYSILSKVKGVEYTGASKVMHLINPKLFVMWDGYIRDGYNCKSTAKEYIDFLRRMQEMFKHTEWDDKDKTLAKAIDEYNYVTYTMPALAKEAEKRRLKKNKNS